MPWPAVAKHTDANLQGDLRVPERYSLHRGRAGDARAAGDAVLTYRSAHS
jgi:hypothetical protein